MRQQFAMILLALTCASAPALAVTLTITPSCSSVQPGLSGTVTYTGQTPNDSGGNTTFTTPFFNQGTNPCGGDYLSEAPGQSTTVNFSTPVTYVGFEWGTPDNYNTFQIFDGATLLASYDGTAIGPDTSFAAYANFFAQGSEVFTSIVFSSSGCCFETDNLSYIEASAATVPEPATFFAPILAIGMWFLLRRLRAPRN